MSWDIRSLFKEEKERSTTVKPPNVLRWARQTVQASLRDYQPKEQPLSVQRLWHAVVPNLRRPIFLIGAPRSGTSFLGQCLGMVPEISYHREPVATKAAARYVYEERWHFAKARFFYRQVYSWLMRIHLDGHLRFAEKTPRNCFIVAFLCRAFPDAQFVHIIRDGRDVALSYARMPWLQSASAGSGQWDPGGYPFGPYARFWVEAERKREFEETSDIHRCAWAWRRHVESALATTTDLSQGHCCEVRYENIASDSDQEARRLIAFLGISNSDSQRKLREAMSHVSARPVGRWRQDLPDAQTKVIKAEAGSLLQRLGYLD